MSEERIDLSTLVDVRVNASEIMMLASCVNILISDDPKAMYIQTAELFRTWTTAQKTQLVAKMGVLMEAIAPDGIREELEKQAEEKFGSHPDQWAEMLEARSLVRRVTDESR